MPVTIAGVGTAIGTSYCYLNREKSQKLIHSLKSYYLAQNTIELLLDGKTLFIEKIYIPLTIIGQQEIQKQKGIIHSQKLEDGRPITHETLFESKEPIKLEKLFEHQDIASKNKKRAIIYGSAGIGKSTLCHHISYQWADGKLWSQFKVIFWIKLRNLNEKRYPQDEKHTIYEVLARECNLESENYQKLFSDEKFRKNCLLILDGYDELVSEELKFKSLKGNVNKPLQAFQEDFDNILITTRPQTIWDIQEAVEIEILGFDQEGIDKYIEEFFFYKEETSVEEKKKKNAGKQAVENQFNNPLVKSLCYIPINLEIFCSLALEGETFSRDVHVTTTMIYERLTDWLIRRFFIQKTSKNRVDIQAPRPKNKKEILSFMRSLEELAWRALEENRLYLKNTEDEPEITNIFEKNELEITDIIKIGPFRIQNQEGYFIHPTFQDFFAASYLARLFKEGKISEVQEIIVKKKFHPRYRLCMRMTAGLLSNDSKNIQLFFNILYLEPRDLALSAELILFADCFGECRGLVDVDQNGNPIYQKTASQMASSLNKQIIRYLNTPSIPEDLKFQLLNGNHNLFCNEDIVGLFHKNLNQYRTGFLNLLRRIIIVGNFLPTKMFEVLIDSIKNKETDALVKTIFFESLGEIAYEKEQSALAENSVQEMIDLLMNNEIEPVFKSGPIKGLGKIGKGKGSVAKKALKGLADLSKNPNIQPYVKLNAAYALSEVFEDSNFLTNDDIKEFINFSFDYNTDYFTKSSVFTVLSGISKGRSPFSGEAMGKLTDLLKDPNIDYESKSFISHGLGEIARQGGSLSKETIRDLISLLSNPKAGFNARRAAAYPIGEIAKRGNFLAKEAMEGLTNLLVNPEADFETKVYVSCALSKFAEGGIDLSKKAIEELTTLLRNKETTSDAKRAAADALLEFAKQGNELSKEIIKELMAFLKDSSSDPYEKRSTIEALARVPNPSKEIVNALINLLIHPRADLEDKKIIVNALEEIMKRGNNILPKKAIEELTALLGDGEVSSEVKRSAADALSEIAKRGNYLVEGALKGLMAFLKDSRSDPYEKRSTIEALARVPNPTQETVNALINLLINPKAALEDKKIIVNALEEIMKRGNNILPKKAIEELAALLGDGGVSSEVKRSAADALLEFVKQGNSLSEEIIKKLENFLINPQTNFYDKRSTIEVLLNVNITGNSFPKQVIKWLIYLFNDNNIHLHINSLAYTIIKQLELESYQIEDEPSLALLIEICKFSGKAIYQVNGKYYIEDRRKIFPVNLNIGQKT